MNGASFKNHSNDQVLLAGLNFYRGIFFVDGKKFIMIQASFIRNSNKIKWIKELNLIQGYKETSERKSMPDISVAHYLYGRLRSSKQLYGLDEQYNTLSDLIERTIMTGQSNSILLVGPHQVGKTRVVSLI